MALAQIRRMASVSTDGAPPRYGSASSAIRILCRSRVLDTHRGTDASVRRRGCRSGVCIANAGVTRHWRMVTRSQNTDSDAVNPARFTRACRSRPRDEQTALARLTRLPHPNRRPPPTHRRILPPLTVEPLGRCAVTVDRPVARNFFLTREKTYIPKLNEILLALKIEREFTKDEILEFYVNKIFLGQHAARSAPTASAPRRRSTTGARSRNSGSPSSR